MHFLAVFVCLLVVIIIPVVIIVVSVLFSLLSLLMLCALFAALFHQHWPGILLISDRVDVVDSRVDADGACVGIAGDHYLSVPCHRVGNCRGDVNDDDGGDCYFDDRQILMLLLPAPVKRSVFFVITSFSMIFHVASLGVIFGGCVVMQIFFSCGGIGCVVFDHGFKSASQPIYDVTVCHVARIAYFSSALGALVHLLCITSSHLRVQVFRLMAWRSCALL